MKCLNAKELAGKISNTVLAGSYVYEYAYYTADNTLACLGYCNIVADESKYIDPVSESPQIYDLSDSVDFTTVAHCIMNDGDIDLATLNITFINNGTCNGIPYTEKDKSVLKKIKLDGEECVGIEILLKSETKTSEGSDTNYKLYTSKDIIDICIPSDKTTYFYIIVYANGTLPSIIATDKRIGENSYRDIKPYIIEGNIRPGVYNSYFHPHSYIINDITEYSNNVVYGAPISELELDQRFTFTEEVQQEYGNVFKYVNNIGITCIKEANVINAMYDSFSTSDHEYNVKLNGITIATYKDDNKYKLSINNLKLFNDISDYGIFEPLMEVVDVKISFNDLKIMYGIDNREFGDIMNNKIKFEKVKEKIDGNIYFRNETISEDSNITKRYVLCVHDNQRMIEYLYYYKDEVTNESSVTYTAFINEYTMQIFCPTMDKFTTQLFSGDKRNMHINNMFYDYCCSIQDVIEVLGNTVSIRGKKGSNVNQNTLQLDEIGLSKYNMFGVPDQF